MNRSPSRTPLESLLRNGLFILCVAGGISALGASIVPMRRQPAPTRPPAPAEQRSVREAVARFDEVLAAQWKSEGMMPSGLAPSGQVARRIALALTGSVPSLEEVRRFQGRWQAADELVAQRTGAGPQGKVSAADRATLFARLAAEPDEHRDVVLAWVSELVDRPTDRRFGDYWAERIARSMVGTHQDPFILYRRRRFVLWLSDQLRANRPYDEVVREMIAGAGVWTDKPGVNFITSTIKPAQGNNQPDPEELGAATARAFLGVRMDCAQCHDHPFVKTWKQSTFREFAAFYGQARNSLAGIQDDVSLVWKPMNDGKPGAPVEPQVPFLPELLPPRRKVDGKGGAAKPVSTAEEELEPLQPEEEASPDADPDEPPMMTMKGGVFARRKQISGGEKPSRQRLAEWLTHPDNTYFAQATANRVWALMWGRALAEPLDDFVTAGNVPPLLAALGDDFRTHRYDLRRLIRIVAAMRAYRGDSAADFEVDSAHEAAWAVFPMTRLRPEQVVGGVLQGSILSTIDAQSHILTQLLRVGEQEQFIERYGDAAADEMKEQGGTIPQRLLMMNGDMVDKRIGDNPFSAAVEIAALAKDDAQAVDAAYWTILTRAPTPDELSHFTAALHGLRGDARRDRLSDLFWSLVNSTEFSWNH